MSFLGEIKRRKVFQVGAVYAVVAWLAIQVITAIETPLGLPDWVDTLVIVLLAIGFPLTLVISWAFDVTPEGIVRDAGGDAPVKSGGRKIEYVLIGLLVITVGWIGYSELGPSGKPARQTLPNSIAVLPFENLSPDPDNAYFAGGIHEEILNQLAKIRDLNVIARTSVLNPDFTDGSMSIPAIALELNVETIMEGSVRYSGNLDTVRVTAQLIDGETNTHIWTDTFDGDLTDFFGFQTEIAVQIASATQAEFSADERERIDKPITNSPEAYALYLKARAMAELGGFASPPEYYQILDQAIALDPDFAEAHAVKAIGYGLAIRFDIQDSQLAFAEMLAIATEHTGQALAIDPDLGLAHMAQAFVYYNNQHGTLAKQALERALQLSPNDVGLLEIAARTLSLLGDHNEAVRMAQRAVDLASDGAEATLAGTLWYAGNPVGAAESFREHINQSPLQNRLLGAVEFVLGNNAAAISNLHRFEELEDINAGWNAIYPDGIAQLAYQYGRLGLQEDARRIFNNLEARRADGQYIATASRAILHLAIGDVDKAYQLLGEINGDWSLYSLRWMKSNILNDPVLEEPRFVELRSRIGVFD
jgi:TolB-like protein